MKQKATLAFYFMENERKPKLLVDQIVEIVCWLQFISDLSYKKQLIQSLLADRVKMSKKQFLAFVENNQKALFSLKVN